MAKVTLRYWAALRAAAGVSEDTVAADTLAEALIAARAIREQQPRFGIVLDICAVVVDEVPVGRRDPATVSLSDGSVVDLLPPFAGG
ncbi:MoaD/ThiS family protein [Phytoactinopolyspora limicola]|uniref:MoaD/ThiS family protein n=1 Tax=Phytoactinopolyspora limicola TaxID=2715536 RepID=UPI001A9C2881|nr:MoaD/ThiS family protein [Phytoactinopolyspora limicola]